jgi:hypothetical protein
VTECFLSAERKRIGPCQGFDFLCPPYSHLCSHLLYFLH